MEKQQNTQLDAELSKLSPFELKGRIIAAADEKVKNAAYTLLNAGRGNPNWIAIEARRAFFALGQFAMDECAGNWTLPEGIAGIPVKEGISVRFSNGCVTIRLSPALTFYAAPTNTRWSNSPPTPTRSFMNGPTESQATTTPRRRVYCSIPK